MAAVLVVGILIGILLLPAISLIEDSFLDETNANDEVVAEPGSCQGVVALTFDDGPDPTLTPQVFSILERYGVKGTFFVLGHKVAVSGELLRQIAFAGHTVQNHSWDHTSMQSLTDEEILQQLEDTNAAAVAAGLPEPVYFRPPFGEYNDRVTSIVEAFGMRVVTWTNVMDPRDWNAPPTELLVGHIKATLTDGGVILLHDIQPGTVEALPQIINVIHEAGYCIRPYNGEDFWVTDAYWGASR